MMQPARLRAELLVMSTMDGVLGCAIVEAATGMVWHAAGAQKGTAHIAEAASDYWRLHLRHRHQFSELGTLQAQVLMHAACRITIVGCGRDLLLILISEAADRVNWSVWKERVATLKALIDSP